MTSTDADADEAMPPRIIKAPGNLPELVRTAFNKARASGVVNFYPTQVMLVDVNYVPFQLRFSPSLANKPKAPEPVGVIDHHVPSHPSTTSVESPVSLPSNNSSSNATDTDTGNSDAPPPPPPKKKPVFDPFDNPLPSMLVCHLPPHHNLVLNKFAIVPEHFILSTKEYKEQTHLLEQLDLEATKECILAYENYRGGEGGEEPKLYAFFNCGEHSGASQPHRHIQLLVVDKMREGLKTLSTIEGGTEGGKWEVLAQKLVDDQQTSIKLPFKTFAERLTPQISGEELHAVYLRLYRRARDAVRQYQSSQAPTSQTQPPQPLSKTDEIDEINTGGEASISYNLAMTQDVMVIVPRLAEGSAITEGEEVVGKLALNGTVLAGTALVKSQKEWDALRRNPARMGELLGGIGVPNADGPEGEGSPRSRAVL